MMTVGGLPTIDPTPEPSPTADVLEQGTVFADRYTIEECVGRGGMGVVYRAQDKIADKAIALKLIRPGRSFSPDILQQLIREGSTARDIRDPNVVAVYDVAEHEGQPFVTMEYIEGESLRSKIRGWAKARQSVPVTTAIRIIRGVLSGLKAAHANDVIHRDLKPENVMICGDDDDPQVKILDFGIAQAVGDDDAAVRTLGTRGYMAPEQITQADLAGPESDIYAVSVMFYELLVGVLPQGHWQPPSNGRSDIRPELDALIEHGLSNNRAKRPQSAEAYLRHLPQPVPPRIRNATERISSQTNQSRTAKQTQGSGIEKLLANPLVWLGGVGMCVLFGGCLILGALLDWELDDDTDSNPNAGANVETIQMPDLIGWDVPAAKSELEQNGIRCFIQGPIDGRIYQQPVAPGFVLKKGDTVTLSSNYF